MYLGTTGNMVLIRYIRNAGEMVLLHFCPYSNKNESSSMSSSVIKSYSLSISLSLFFRYKTIFIEEPHVWCYDKA